MSTPVVTDKWAGNLTCTFCGRDRLMADAFSKTNLQKHRSGTAQLKCKQCVQAAEANERNKSSVAIDTSETKSCCACEKQLDASYFTKTQWNKKDNNNKCKRCVQDAVQAEAQQNEQNAQNKLLAAREAVQIAQRSGNSLEILKAESVLAALEGEKVTGLKPVKMAGRGGRRGRGRRR